MKMELHPKNRAEGGAENIGRRKELNAASRSSKRAGDWPMPVKVMGALDRNW